MVVRKRLDISGNALVFVTTTVREWAPVFDNHQFATAALVQLAETTSHYDVRIAGYVLMPTHLHLLLGFEHLDNLSLLMQSYKSLSSRRLIRMIPDKSKGLFAGSSPRTFWKPRFDDLVIWSEKQFKIKLDYIHSNPVRAGLVEKASDYLYSSADSWLSGKQGLIEVDKEWTWV